MYWKTPSAGSQNVLARFGDAGKVAAECDVTVAVLGINKSIEREGQDRFSLELPVDQQEFIKELYKVNPNTVVVLVAGSSMAVNWMDENVPAILNAWYPGEQGGNAVAEVLFGDYNLIVNDEMLHSCTNYECYKGIYSSFNSMNMFEIAHSLNRQYGPEQWCIYRGKHLMSFVDNHDVTRIASILTIKNHLPLTYGLLLGMPGVPCIYYGSEWGEEGVKAPNNDYALRPCFEEPKPNELTEEIKKMIHVRTGSNALCHGSYRNVVLTNHQLIFERRTDDERMLVAINASDAPFTAHNGELGGTMTDLLTGNEIQMSGQLEMPPYSVQYLK